MIIKSSFTCRHHSVRARLFEVRRWHETAKAVARSASPSAAQTTNEFELNESDIAVTIAAGLDLETHSALRHFAISMRN
jgi:hypothetical protein